ncbi:MAG: ribosome silencing factor [Clostridia bacterium]|nr:ribosome silencing factor [Clostridia bacterium]
MENDKKNLTPLEIAEYAVSVLDGKKARDIKLLHVEKRTVIADYFIICTGTSRTQIRSLADEVEEKLAERGYPVLRTEGMETGTWVLKDFGPGIIHIFNAEYRDFYKLEKLYDDNGEVNVEAFLGEE